MSDFLSNFSGDDYKENLPKKKKNTVKKDAPKEKETTDTPKKRKRRRKHTSSDQTRELFDNPNLIEDNEEIIKESRPRKLESVSDDSNELHDIEIDPEYSKKQKRKKILIGASIILALVLSYVVYYQMTRIKMPDFQDKSVTEARKWAAENRMELEIKEAYSLKSESSDVMKQGVAPGKNVKKGSTISLTVSEGPDPEEIIKLPDFKTIGEKEASEFVTKNKAENLSILTEYSDKVEKGKFIRMDFSDKEVTSENYRRRDSLNVYYSKGKEVFEKDIPVPDFSGKMKNDVEDWAQKNSIAMTYEEVDSDKIEEGKIISQSIEKNKKIAKKDKMSVKISLGKAIIVPNYGYYSAESSLTAVEGLDLSVQQLFSDAVPYGQLISQSVEAGTKLTAKNSKSVKVIYSYGQPYIKSYFGQLEGDIPKFLYDDFNSKGANITYGTYYVDSDAQKGEIVKMSAYNQYIASDSYITFGISNGKFADLPGKTPEGDSGDINKKEADLAN